MHTQTHIIHVFSCSITNWCSHACSTKPKDVWQEVKLGICRSPWFARLISITGLVVYGYPPLLSLAPSWGVGASCLAIPKPQPQLLLLNKALEGVHYFQSFTICVYVTGCIFLCLCVRVCNIGIWAFFFWTQIIGLMTSTQHCWRWQKSKRQDGYVCV